MTSTSAVPDPDTNPGGHDSGVQLWDGSSLTLEEASAYRSRGNERLIVLAGMPDSGKTSLLIAPYVRLLNGRIGAYTFSQSETLIGFEQRCHLSRIRSLASEPDIEHTRVSDTLKFLHLNVEASGAAENRTLLLPDISGESYDAATNSDEDIVPLAILRDADYLAFLIDTGKLLEPATRHATTERLRLLVESTKKAGLIVVPKVTLLATKIDKVPVDDRQMISDLCGRLTKEFSFHGCEFVFHVVSTRKHATIEYEGLEQEMMRWLSVDRG